MPELQNLLETAEQDAGKFLVPQEVLDSGQNRDDSAECRMNFATTYRRRHDEDVELHNAICGSHSEFFVGPAGREFEKFGPPVPLGPHPHPVIPHAHQQWATTKKSFIATGSSKESSFVYYIVSV
jgi:hypothetical protein